MKLAPLFTVKDNRLYFLSDNSAISLENVPTLAANAFRLTDDLFVRIELPWSLIELSEDSYNEEFLASLREFLKEKDEKNQFAILAPVVDKQLLDDGQKERFINTFNHTARRVKDCTSVAGMEIPKDFGETAADEFMDTLNKKHGHYVYFLRKDKTQNPSIVLY